MAERRYLLRTFGCQMNEHDSERIAGLLTSDGYVSTEEAADASVVVFNTCAIRENADNRLYGNLGHLRPLKHGEPADADRRGRVPRAEGRGTIRERAPWVDVVVGTHALPGLLDLLQPCGDRGPAARRPRADRDLPERPARAPGGRAPRVGLDRGGMRQRVHLLHRAARPRSAALPPDRRRPGRGAGARAPRRGRGHAARPERQHVRPRPDGAGVGQASAVRRAAPGRERGRRAPADPVHEPAPARLHARRDRRDGRERQGVRAHPLPAAVGFGPRAQGDAALVPSRALPGLARPDPRRDPGHRGDAPTSSSGSPARPSRTSRTRSTSFGGRGSTRRTRSSTRPGPGRAPRRWTTSSPSRWSRSGSTGWSRSRRRSRSNGCASRSARRPRC